MEEDLITPAPEFVQGFNEGYTLAWHLPDLAAQLSEATKENERGTGFKAGRQQVLVERERERDPAWLRGDFTEPFRDRGGPDKERDIEPEL